MEMSNKLLQKWFHHIFHYTVYLKYHQHLHFDIIHDTNMHNKIQPLKIIIFLVFKAKLDYNFSAAGYNFIIHLLLIQLSCVAVAVA